MTTLQALKIMKTILTGKKKEISEKLKKIDLENLVNYGWVKLKKI